MKKIFFFALSIFASVSLMATQVKVAADTDLQAAVNGASSGDTVLVQAGTYEGNFTMKDGVYVSGGWNEDFTAQTKHASILDAKQSGRVLNQPADFTTLTIWDNFTIQNGYLNKYVDQWGAGVALLKNGRVINCLVQNNSFGGEYSGNCAGGGICNNSGGDTCAINCVVRNNKATHGGGIRTAGIAVNCIVENNEATGNGGGVYLHYLGGLHNSIVRNNVCKKDVGGVDMGAAGCAMYNCLIVGNHADGVIGGVQARKGNNVVNTTIVGNSHNTTEATRISWAGFRASDNTPTNYNDKLFVNNVIWGNKHNGEVIAEQVMPYLKHYVSNGTFANNALQGTTDINVTYIQLNAENNPQFVDSTCAIAWTSPLYNAGTNDAVAKILGDKDVYGNARKQGANIEIGAVEHTEYTATIELGEGGTLEVDYTGEKTPLAAGKISVPAGFTTKLYVTPAENYVLESITLNGEALVAEEGVYTIPAVTGDITLKVVFDCTLTLYKVAAGEDLQAAVNKASAGDTVLVQAGTYEGNFTMKDGVYVSGGWNEDFTAQTEHASILDAKQSGRVLNQPKDFTTLTIWDNFTIQNGFLAAYVDQWGPGVALLKNGRVSNCLVQNNSFGGEYSGNCAGGGICNNTAGDTCAINCVVRNNKGTHGGGVRAAGIVVNCIIENNEATKNGGGVYVHHIGQLHNSIVRNNVSKADVGGVDIAAAGGAVYNCLVVGNHADGNIGGVQARKANNVVNTTIVGNSHNTTDESRILWAGFRASSNTEGDYNGKLFVNNVIWGNKHNGEVVAEQVMPYLKHYVSKGTFANNALQGTANVNATYIQLSAENNPQFNEDYSFAWSSPLYNAGTNDAVAKILGDKDVYGNARKQGENIDLGAVEHTVHTLTVAAVENGTLALEVLGQTMPLEAKAYEVPAGFTATILATPAEKYALESILVNGSVLAAVEDVYTLPAVQSDITLGATFVAIPDTPTALENIMDMSNVVAVYDLLGHQVNATPANLTSGLYIVVTTQGTHKISIK